MGLAPGLVLLSETACLPDQETKASMRRCCLTSEPTAMGSLNVQQMHRAQNPMFCFKVKPSEAASFPPVKQVLRRKKNIREAARHRYDWWLSMLSAAWEKEACTLVAVVLPSESILLLLRAREMMRASSTCLSSYSKMELLWKSARKFRVVEDSGFHPTLPPNLCFLLRQVLAVE